jgi:hypothetical protein
MPFMIYFIPRFSFKSLPNIYFPVLIGGGYNRNSIYSSLIDYSLTLIGTGIQWKIHDKFGFRAIITYDILPKIIYKLEIGGFIYINTQVEENQELNSNKNPVDLNIDLYLSHFYGTPFDDYEYLFSLGGSLEVVYTFFDFIGAGIQISYIDFFNNQVRSIFSTKLNINLETGTYQGFSIMIKGSFGILSYLGFFQDINELLDFGFGLRYMINEYISIRSQVLYCMGLGSFVEMKVQTGIVINL